VVLVISTLVVVAALGVPAVMVGLLRVAMVVLECQAKLMAHPGIMLGEEEEDGVPAA
jgi:hypothetical protein